MIKKLPILIALLIVITGIMAHFLVYKKSKHRPLYYNTSVFSAVFLDNQQVYFGRITRETADTLILENVYYLDNSIQQAYQKDLVKLATDSAKLSLLKLGDELHGPQDKMIINRSHILFFEEMKESGEIIDAIMKNESQK